MKPAVLWNRKPEIDSKEIRRAKLTNTAFRFVTVSPFLR
jgi:hypothetical protein